MSTSALRPEPGIQSTEEQDPTSVLTDVTVFLRRQEGRLGEMTASFGEQASTSRIGDVRRIVALYLDALDRAAIAYETGAPDLGSTTGLNGSGHAIQSAFKVVWRAAVARARLRRGGVDVGWQALEVMFDALVEERVRLEALALRVMPSVSRTSRRLDAVRAVLDETRRVGEAELGYDLDRRHLAFILAGPGACVVSGNFSDDLQCMTLSVSPGRDNEVWMWCACPDSSERHMSRTLEMYLASSPLVTASMGERASGPDGFRATHRQALRARSFAGASPGEVTWFRDIALESLVLDDGDPAAARRFVSMELGAIDPHARGDRELLETVVRYFENGQSAASAAAALGIHDQTVSNRLRRLEERLGRSVASRSTELHLAARLALSCDSRVA